MSKRIGDPISLSRDVEAVQIPSGFSMVLEKETEVRVTQALGGSFTLMTPMGLARIDGRDADALGLEPEAASPPAPATEASTPEELRQAVWDQLKTCYDPEIPVNIVDLGLVYACDVTPLESGGNRVDFRFTLTAPGCGMGDWLAHDMRAKVEALPGVAEANVEVVFDPPWSQDMMSEAARLELGML